MGLLFCEAFSAFFKMICSCFQIYNMCRGIDKRKDFLEKVPRKSVSCDINYGIRFTEA